MPKYKDTIIAFEDYFDEPRIARDFRNLRVVTYHDYMNVLHLDRHDEELPVADPNPTRRVNAFVNMGRWVWGCAKCESSYILERGRSSAICTECYSPEWVNVVWPSDSDTKAIESKLLEISGPRLHAPLRNWEPSWTLDQLTAMVDQVHLRVLEGRHDYRSLSIGQTRNWTAGERLTATNMNLFITQLLRDVAGRNGVTEFEDAIKLPSQVNPTSPEDGMLNHNSATSRFDARLGGKWEPWMIQGDVDSRINTLSGLGYIHLLADMRIGLSSSNRFSLDFQAAKNYQVVSARRNLNVGGSHNKPIVEVTFAAPVPDLNYLRGANVRDKISTTVYSFVVDVSTGGNKRLFFVIWGIRI